MIYFIISLSIVTDEYIRTTKETNAEICAWYVLNILSSCIVGNSSKLIIFSIQ